MSIEIKSRVLQPEILDQLDPSDPSALRSRQDLRRLDLFLGNSRWIARTVQECQRNTRCAHIIELGAGDGLLCNRLSRMIPEANITGLDLVPSPSYLPKGAKWISGDFFQTLPKLKTDIVVGSLVLHHFSDECLSQLGTILKNSRLLVFAEPHRSMLARGLSMLALPFVGDVTKHDMRVSIGAGFREGELFKLLSLDPSQWLFKEFCDWRGILRVTALRC